LSGEPSGGAAGRGMAIVGHPGKRGNLGHEAQHIVASRKVVKTQFFGPC